MKNISTLSVYFCFISVVRELTLTITHRSLHLFICNVLHLSKPTKSFQGVLNCLVLIAGKAHIAYCTHQFGKLSWTCLLFLERYGIVSNSSLLECRIVNINVFDYLPYILHQIYYESFIIYVLMIFISNDFGNHLKM